MTAPTFTFDGVLFFPVTPFAADGSVDPGLLTEHVAARMEHEPGAVFAACGTGEFHSLSIDEVGVATQAAVVGASGARPVFTGAGGPLAHAVSCAKIAEDAGAEGLLVLPPYLVSAPVEGLLAYVETIVEATDLPVIVYHRANAQFTPAAAVRLAADPRVVGFKDGVGSMDLTQRIVLAVHASGRTDWLFFNGLLTAELTQAAFRAIGVPLYSSAVFAMAPAISNAFYAAYVNHDEARRIELLTEFYEPLVELRDRVGGYAVSLIKAGVRHAGLPVGSVRAPLVDPNPTDLADLERLLAHGHSLVP